ncbi:MAG: DUF2058 family protein [Xanthomonadales bacterium]|uniref:DUF2058 family protein n=1 Tax=Dokdonella sp. TaxID=2291710 RepID=UPI002C79A5B8|nr:DUF2058 family protein [Xanthomonadales bacterium]HQV72853.1 DUF2058 family protein [Dokdonella sp.]MBK7011657.1 DUF2058 family protein [Xanthomonadales bacterium]MBK7209307.1 DUF2058 family protein [Xanthomonadales bacterium]MBL0223508.1 DUF2058 family protein [Xanthomonadales bacterium]
MADSLRDQLLKSGLVQKLKAQPQPVARPQRPPNKSRADAGMAKPASPKAARSQEEIDLARAYGLRDRAERAERDREKQQAEQRAREKADRKQKLAALLADKALNKVDAEIARHFPHGEKICRVYCTADQLVEVNAGQLGVVQYRGRYLLVTREVAEQVRAISAEALVLLCDPDAPTEDDIPADLIW